MKVASFVLFCLWIGLCVAEDPKGLTVVPLPRFECNPYEVKTNEPSPTNVNELAPHDIDVIMSLGDSMTAAFAANAGHFLVTDPIIPREDRYLSYMNGGGSMQYSVNNFLKLYNRDIQGGSIGQTLPLDGASFRGHHINPQLKGMIGLNAAISGAKVQDLHQEIDLLVEQLHSDLYNETIDFDNSWKMASILIGANNLCAICKGDDANTPETYGSLLNSSIAYLEESIPRVRLNLLPMFNVTQVFAWSRTDAYCTRIFDLFDECPCLSVTKTPEDWEAVNQGAVAYYEQLLNVVEYWSTRQTDTFSVTLQPVTRNFHILNGDLTSNFDCFHPSTISHAWLGAFIWNSIWLPSDQKPLETTPTMLNGFEFVCPDRNTYMK